MNINMRNLSVTGAALVLVGLGIYSVTLVQKIKNLSGLIRQLRERCGALQAGLTAQFRIVEDLTRLRENDQERFRDLEQINIQLRARLEQEPVDSMTHAPTVATAAAEGTVAPTQSSWWQADLARCESRKARIAYVSNFFSQQIINGGSPEKKEAINALVSHTYSSDLQRHFVTINNDLVSFFDWIISDASNLRDFSFDHICTILLLVKRAQCCGQDSRARYENGFSQLNAKATTLLEAIEVNVIQNLPPFFKEFIDNLVARTSFEYENRAARSTSNCFALFTSWWRVTKRMGDLPKGVESWTEVVEYHATLPPARNAQAPWS